MFSPSSLTPPILWNNFGLNLELSIWSSHLQLLRKACCDKLALHLFVVCSWESASTQHCSLMTVLPQLPFLIENKLRFPNLFIDIGIMLILVILMS